MCLILVSTVIVLLQLSSTTAYNQCCNNGTENVLTGAFRECLEGEINLPCTERYLINPMREDVENFTIDDDDNLLIFNNKHRKQYQISPNKYCISKNDYDEEVALLCYDTDTIDQIPDTLKNATWYVRATCALLSAVCLFITFAVYLLSPDLQDIEGTCILHLSFGLGLSHICLAALQLEPAAYEEFCDISAFSVDATFLFSFAWLSVLIFHTWKAIIKPQVRMRIPWLLVYCGYSYGVTFLILATAVVSHKVAMNDEPPGLVLSRCWFTGPQEIWAYFYVPVTLLAAMCLILLLWCAKLLWLNSNSKPNSLEIESLKRKVMVFGHLFYIMTLAWLLEVVSYVHDNRQGWAISWFWELNDYKNFSQGIIIFVSLVLLRKKALKALVKFEICGVHLPEKLNILYDEETEYENNRKRRKYIAVPQATSATNV